MSMFNRMLRRICLVTAAGLLMLTACGGTDYRTDVWQPGDTVLDRDAAGQDADQDVGADTGLDSSGTDAVDAADVAPDDVSVDACDPRVMGTGEVRARQIACAGELVGGPESLGVVGDYLLENSSVRFVIRAGTSWEFVGLDGGNIVDADRVRPAGEEGQDRFRELLPLFGFNALDVGEVEIGNPGNDGEAVVRVSGVPASMPLLEAFMPGFPVLNVNIVHEYVLAADSDSLLIRTSVSIPSGAPGVDISPVEGYFVSGELAGFSPYLMPLAVHSGASVSYGYLGSKGFSVTDIGAIPLGLSDPIPVATGGQIVVERHLVVGDGSVSSVTDVALELVGIETADVEGCVTAGGVAAGAGVEVRARTRTGKLLTYFRTGDDGCFAGRLPIGEATLTATCAGCLEGDALNIAVDADGLAGLALAGHKPSYIEAAVTDDADRPIPARISLLPSDTPDADAVFVAAWPSPKRFPVAPGRWTVIASRGFEYGRAEAEVEVAEGETTTVALALTREVSTPGAMAAEFHVHSHNSVDSLAPPTERALAFGCEGVEFVASSDHDFVTDYSSIVASLGLSAFVTTAPGVEISSVQSGHFNAWPMQGDVSKSGNGAPVWFGKSPGALAAEIRAGHPERVFQVNHPRFEDKSTFDLIDFDPADATAHANPLDLGLPADTDLNDLGFDAYEIYNGIGRNDVDEQLLDWYSLLWTGRRITATAGGDSHDQKAFSGNPRNMVLVGEDDPTAIDALDVAAAVKAMRVVVTSGPWLEAALVNPETGLPVLPGETVTDTDGQIDVHLHVSAPSWMELTELKVIVGGEDGMTIALEPGGIDRLDTTVTIAATADTWIVAIVRGPLTEPLIARLAPFALTNPTYLDADGNGRFDPRQ